MYVSGLPQVFHDDKMICLVRLCTVSLLCCVIIELMVSAASDERLIVVGHLILGCDCDYMITSLGAI